MNTPEHIAAINALLRSHIAHGAELCLGADGPVPHLTMRIEAAVWDGATLVFTEAGADNEFGTHELTADHAEARGSFIKFQHGQACMADVDLIPPD